VRSLQFAAGGLKIKDFEVNPADDLTDLQDGNPGITFYLIRNPNDEPSYRFQLGCGPGGDLIGGIDNLRMIPLRGDSLFSANVAGARPVGQVPGL